MSLNNALDFPGRARFLGVCAHVGILREQCRIEISCYQYCLGVVYMFQFRQDFVKFHHEVCRGSVVAG
jgi:hypothetical protein